MATVTTTTPGAVPSPLRRLAASYPLSSYFGLSFALSAVLVLPISLTRNIGAGLLPYELPDALTHGSVLLAMLAHASGNAATQWLTALLARSGLAVPEAGLSGWLITSGWLNTLAYGAAALLLLVLTRGRLGAGATPVPER